MGHLAVGPDGDDGDVVDPGVMEGADPGTDLGHVADGHDLAHDPFAARRLQVALRVAALQQVGPVVHQLDVPGRVDAGRREPRGEVISQDDRQGDDQQRAALTPGRGGALVDPCPRPGGVRDRHEEGEGPIGARAGESHHAASQGGDDEGRLGGRKGSRVRRRLVRLQVGGHRREHRQVLVAPLRAHALGVRRPKAQHESAARELREGSRARVGRGRVTGIDAGDPQAHRDAAGQL